MDYARLGNTGLKVSRLALGCMSYGDPTTPDAHPWALTEDKAQLFFQQAVELGVTFWDTANVYQLVGATKPNHLAEAVDAIGLELTDEEAQELEAPYHQYRPSWY
ncbi:MAG TPA: aldo/keto reductase [Gaiellaceae bacterium]|nr:aldo/keto reductase [Gaiellaceae bacterium]